MISRNKTLNRYPKILGVKVTPITVSNLHVQIANYIQTRQKALVLHVNIHAINLAYDKAWLRHFFNSSSIVFCDGVGVMLGAHVLGYYIPERITYADWTWQLAEFVALRGYTLYFLGGKPGIAEAARYRLLKRFPALQVVGTHHGYFDKTPGSPENAKVIEGINSVSPNILLVAFGMPLQERWLMENRARIDANVVLTGGAVFDYISGELRRGPKWMTDHGMEWLARLIIEPRRLWRRYIVGNPLFFYRVLKQKFGLLYLDE